MKNVNKEELHYIFKGIANKEEKEFKRLYEEYQKLVYGISFSILKNRENSEEMVQEVFTKIWSMPVEYLPTNHEASWLYRLTKNETLNFLRKQKEKVDMEELYYIGKEDKELEAIVERENYNKILSKLEEKDQEIMSLKILSALSFQEISRILDMPMGTVQWRYYKALHTLKTLLSSLSMYEEDYSLEKAVEKGYFVIAHNKIYNKHKLEQFIENTSINSKNRIEDSIKIVQYTTEGDPIITELSYKIKDETYLLGGKPVNKTTYILKVDNTRDKWSVKEDRKVTINDDLPGNFYGITENKDGDTVNVDLALYAEINYANENVKRYETINICSYSSSMEQSEIERYDYNIYAYDGSVNILINGKDNGKYVSRWWQYGISL